MSRLPNPYTPGMHNALMQHPAHRHAAVNSAIEDAFGAVAMDLTMPQPVGYVDAEHYPAYAGITLPTFTLLHDSPEYRMGVRHGVLATLGIVGFIALLRAAFRR